MLLGVSRAKWLYKRCRLMYLPSQLQPPISCFSGSCVCPDSRFVSPKKPQRDTHYICEKHLMCHVPFTSHRNHFNFAMRVKSACPYKYTAGADSNQSLQESQYNWICSEKALFLTLTAETFQFQKHFHLYIRTAAQCFCGVPHRLVSQTFCRELLSNLSFSSSSTGRHSTWGCRMLLKEVQGKH